MSHCGALSPCDQFSKERGCACGERVRAEMDAEKPRSVPSAPPRVAVALGAVRSLLGRENRTEESA